jgi:hypothetical protein
LPSIIHVSWPIGRKRSRYDGALLVFFKPTEREDIHRMTTESGTDTPAARRRKLMKVSREQGMTRDERLELASYILRRDITTWKTLSDDQVWRLLDALEGHELRLVQIASRPPPDTALSSLD